MRQLRLLGPFRVSYDESPLSLPAGRVRGLLAYLALFSTTNCSRERLADLLWPDAPPERSRRLLSNLIYQIRQTLGAAWLTSEGDQIHLNMVDLWVDVAEFDRLVRPADPAALTEAVALYTDDLLPDMYDDWLTAPRLERREVYLTALATLVGVHQKQNDLLTALHFARRLVLTEPLREENQQTYLHLLGRLGRRNEALAHYVALARLLQTELGMTPLAETRVIAETIRREAIADAHDQIADPDALVACLEHIPDKPLNVENPGGIASVLEVGYILPLEHPDYVTIALAHRNTPLGRPLHDADCVLVTWTLHASEDDLVRDKSARRQTVLKRLLSEAAAQDAAPTDDDLARVLGVSRRTILRDMEFLAQQGITRPTRKRKA